MKKFHFLFVLLTAFSLNAVRITEFMASNDHTIKDSYGDSSDWIELYNDGDTFSLSGWTLTDDAKKPQKWHFPDTNFFAGTYMLVWASDRKISIPGEEMHTGFKLSASGEYLGLLDPTGAVVSEFSPKFPQQYEDISYGVGCYSTTSHIMLRNTNTFCKAFVPTDGDIDNIWFDKTFDDSSWKVGNSGVGYETNPGQTYDFTPFIGLDILNEMYLINPSAYIRMPFELEEKNDLKKLTLRMLYKDGFVAYLNGVEVTRVNAPGEVYWNSTSSSYHTDEDALVFEDIDISEHITLLNKGYNVLCIQGLAESISNSNFLVDAQLLGEEVEHIEFLDVGYFSQATPNVINGPAYENWLQPLTFSHDSGFYEQPFLLVITSPDKGTTIRYTTDGTEPTTEYGTVYSQGIQINKTTILRIGVFKDGSVSQRPVAKTYVFLDDVIAQADGERPGEQWPSEPVKKQVLDYGMDTRITRSAEYGPLMKDAFKQIPMLSIVISPGNLFNASTGIYVNPGQDGRSWERYAQLNYLTHDGSEGFNVGCGLRIRGGASRHADNAKHSFRLFFRSEYGDSKLLYPIFGDEGASSFDKVDLRTAQNWSWSRTNGNDPRHNIMCREVFSRDLQREMGEPYTRSRYFHLLLNGHYWGLYQYQERSEENFAKIYFGGEKEDFDVIKTSDHKAYASNGSMDALKTLWQMTTNGFTEETYNIAIGRNPDGTRNSAYPVLLDPTNLADYVIIYNFVGSKDGPLTGGNNRLNNLYMIYNRAHSSGFKFFCHDFEHALVSNYLLADLTVYITTGETDLNLFNPRYLHQKLCDVESYRRVFQSRVSRHYFNNGILTLNNSINLFMQRANEIDLAIICESARWGDARTDYKEYQPFTKNEHWIAELKWITGTCFRTRYNRNLTQYRNHGWYPNATPPTITPNGGRVVPGTRVTLRGNDNLKYTIDGSDPFTSLTAVIYTEPIIVDRPMEIRCCLDPDFSDDPLDVSAKFTLDEDNPLIVTELMYMPFGPDRGSNFTANDYEFIELYNNSNRAYYPDGQVVTGGVNFVFSNGSSKIEPGEYVLIVSNLEAFSNRYNTNDLHIAGTYEGNLSDNGDHIYLSNYDFSFSGFWYDGARGLGRSIVSQDYDISLDQYSNKNAWKLSGEPYGSPGRKDIPEPSFLITYLLIILGARGFFLKLR